MLDQLKVRQIVGPETKNLNEFCGAGLQMIMTNRLFDHRLVTASLSNPVETESDEETAEYNAGE